MVCRAHFGIVSGLGWATNKHNRKIKTNQTIRCVRKACNCCADECSNAGRSHPHPRPASPIYNRNKGRQHEFNIPCVVLPVYFCAHRQLVQLRSEFMIKRNLPARIFGMLSMLTHSHTHTHVGCVCVSVFIRIRHRVRKRGRLAVASYAGRTRTHRTAFLPADNYAADARGADNVIQRNVFGSDGHIMRVQVGERAGEMERGLG